MRERNHWKFAPGAEVYGSPEMFHAPLGARNSLKFSLACPPTPAPRCGSSYGHISILKSVSGCRSGPASSMATVRPPSVRTFAAMPPPAPEPITQTSYVLGERFTWAIGNTLLQFSFFHLRNRVIGGTRGERHVGERRIDAGGRSHARTVWHEKIFDFVRLIVGVEHGGFGIAAHARGAHLVNGQAGRIVFDERADFAGARSGEHFGGLNGHILEQSLFVFAEGAMNLDGGNAPSVFLLGINFQVVLRIGQAFAEAIETEMPGAGAAQRVFEIGADARSGDAAVPAIARAAALIAIATQECGVFGLYVSETRNVDAVGTIAEIVLVFVAGN